MFNQNLHTVASIGLSIGKNAADLVRFEANEALGELFQLTVEVLFRDAANQSVDLAKCLGEAATVTLTQGNGSIRHFHGVVVSVAFVERTVTGVRAQLIMRPRLYLFAHNKDTRLFEEMTAPEIITSVLGVCGVAHTKKLSGTYRKRGYTTQFGESHFAFISRLMEEEGIYYYFTHNEAAHTLVLSDSKSSHDKARPDLLVYDPDMDDINIANTLDKGDNFVHTWQQTLSALGHKEVNLWDNLFTMPGNHLEQTSALLAHPGGNKVPMVAEVYDFEGTYDLHQPASGEEDAGEGNRHIQFAKARAKLRSEILEARRRTHVAIALSPMLACGATFRLEDQPKGMIEVDEFLMTRVRTVVYGAGFESGSGKSAENITEMEVIPHDTPWRSEPATPRPIAHGPQTAIVVGPKDEEIFTDKYGRVKVQFPWDRVGKNDPHSSAWLRVAQTGGLGNINMPRVGHEVLVGFLDGNPDRPIVIGRLFNAEQMPIYALPDHKTRTVWRSKTYGVPTGKSATEALDKESKPLDDVKDTDGNELRFEDKYGEEEVFLLAHRNMNTRVRFDETHHVGRNQETKIWFDAVRDVERDQSVSIGRDSEVKIGQHSTIETTGNEKRTVKGTSDVTITGSHTVLMEAEASYTTKGKNTVKVDGDDKQDYGGKSEIDVGSTLTIKAGTKIVLSVGGNSIEISQTGIKINGTMVKIDAQATADFSGAMTTVKASGVLTAQGSLVKIN
ncbi:MULTISPECIES: type VI secretion system Vgr family protein [Asticcacaulis]|uniref:type VI secretion system Vgr family protein n=1 Tax=Asticcacaulis TaxID=76890 RepID=UPI001AE6278D|nr:MULTISPECIES: type VI secretion system tip protein TssI/VgrG [Asticcacaulis]MBP2161037.1 type VI secretion system secreted protein VgrG [Asticcacaulis solisilvae]MDR6802082.1 type VI secretion system secreted protein VgrG [Asticcacaulis sp. BE141]